MLSAFYYLIQMTSMEKIVGEMFSAGQVSARVIDCIWERVEQHSGSTAGTSSETVVMPVGVGFTELGASLRILAMVAQAVPSTMTEDRVALVVAAGLSTDTLQRGMCGSCPSYYTVLYHTTANNTYPTTITTTQATCQLSRPLCSACRPPPLS